MGSDFITAIVSVLAAIVGIAIVAVIFQQGNTASTTITAAGSAFNTIVSQAVNPGGNFNSIGGLITV